MLPVLQAEVLCDCVENLHLVPQLGLRVDVGHPQTAGVLGYVADLDLSSRRGQTEGELAAVVHRRAAVREVKKEKLAAINLQVLYLQVVDTDVVAEGVIDSSHRPINLVQFLSEPAHLPRGFPEREQKQNFILHLIKSIIFYTSMLRR